MDANWLKETIGAPLQAALTAMVVEQPTDPVEFLGAFLLKHVEAEVSKDAQAALFAKANEMVKMQEAEIDAAAAEATAFAIAAEKPLPGEIELMEELEKETEVPELFSKVLEFVQTNTRASGCYLARKEYTAAIDEVPATPVITFIAESSGTGGGVVGSTLMGVPEGVDSEEAKPEGVSFGLFVGKEPAQPQVIKDPETGEEDGDVSPPGVTYPTEIIVENVVRKDAIKFFGVPKLGAYVCVPIRYKSCLHSDSIINNKSEDENVDESSPKFLDCEMLLGLHTMGQAGRQFTKSEIALAQKVAIALAAALGRSEKRIWDEEVAKILSESENVNSMTEKIEKAKVDAQSAMNEEVAGLAEDLPEDEKNMKASLASFASAVKVLKSVQSEVAALGSKRLPLKLDFVRILTAFLFTLGFSKEDFIDSATKKVNWEKMRKCFAGDAELLLEKIDSYRPDSATNSYPKYARVEEIRSLIAIDDMPSDAFFGTAILDFVNAANDARESAASYRKVEAEAAEQHS